MGGIIEDEFLVRVCVSLIHVCILKFVCAYKKIFVSLSPRVCVKYRWVNAVTPSKCKYSYSNKTQ